MESDLSEIILVKTKRMRPVVHTLTFSGPTPHTIIEWLSLRRRVLAQFKPTPHRFLLLIETDQMPIRQFFYQLRRIAQDTTSPASRTAVVVRSKVVYSMMTVFLRRYPVDAIQTIRLFRQEQLDEARSWLNG